MTRWQKSVTLKAIRENKVNGFYTGHIATPADMVGKMEPFQPCWNAQYLNDGTQEFFDDIKDCQKCMRPASTRCGAYSTRYGLSQKAYPIMDKNHRAERVLLALVTVGTVFVVAWCLTEI